MHQNYCLTPLSAIRKYYKAKPFSPVDVPWYVETHSEGADSMLQRHA